MSQIVRDTGLTAAEPMGYRRRPVNMEGATTHSRLRAALTD